MKILIINGPNLNMLGTRQPDLYGHQSFDNYLEQLQQAMPHVQLAYFQSNHEGAIIEQIQQAAVTYNALIINPGAYSHTSIAIADAIRSISLPVVEVHLTNIHAREAYRQHSFTAQACRGIISGFGLDSYRLAVLHLSL